MRVTCPECNEKSRITNRNQLAATVSDLYCQCSNVFCGHTFVMKLAYSHTIKPGRDRINGLLFDFLRAMGRDQRRQIVDNVDDVERSANAAR